MERARETSLVAFLLLMVLGAVRSMRSSTDSLGGLSFSAALAVSLALARVSIEVRAERRTGVESVSVDDLIFAAKGAADW